MSEGPERGERIWEGRGILWRRREGGAAESSSGATTVIVVGDEQEQDDQRRVRFSPFVVGTVSAAVIVVTLLGSFIAGLWDESDLGGTRLGTVVEVERAGALYVPKHNIFVVIDDEGLPVALRAASALRRPVYYCPASGGFQTSHGDRFDHVGRYITGPAPRGLDRVGVRHQGGEVFIDPQVVIQGPSRGVKGIWHQPPCGEGARVNPDSGRHEST